MSQTQTLVSPIKTAHILKMKKRGMHPADSHITALFNACANSPFLGDGLQRATKLRQQLTDSNYLLNRQQYHAMIKAFGRSGDLSTAFKIADEMISNRLPLTTETLTFLLQACISLPKDGFNHALLVWRRMRKEKVTPDIFSYNLMLRAARDCGVGDVSKVGQQQSISSLLTEGDENDPVIAYLPKSTSVTNNQHQHKKEMIEFNMRDQKTIMPNFLMDQVQSCNTVIEMSSLNRSENRLALLGNVEGVLSEMKRDHARPDIKTFTLLLETMESNTELEKLLLEHLKKLGITPDVDFFNLLIKKRQLRFDYSGGQEVLSYFSNYQLYPNIMTFGVLAMGCIKQEDAFKLIDVMDQAGFRVNNEIFGAMLRNAVEKKKCFYIIELLNWAVKTDFTLDEKALLLIDNFKSDTMKNLAKFDRGEEVDRIYGKQSFRHSYGVFCMNYKLYLSNLKVAIEPHPWKQFRYPKENKE